MRRRFVEHRRWMSRCYLLLCSTVVLRLMAGLATLTGVEATWIDPLVAWASWLLPLAAFELSRRSGLLVKSAGSHRDMKLQRADAKSV